MIFFLLGLVVYHMTGNEEMAYGVGMILLALTTAVYLLDSTKLEGLLPNIMTALSLFERFNAFVNGVFDMTAIVYYVTFAAFFLFLSVQSLEKRRYN